MPEAPEPILPLRRPAMLLATWFGAGRLPGMPGTWGSLAALPFAWVIEVFAGRSGLVIAGVVLFGIGCWAAERACRSLGKEDPGEIVIDEVAAQWLVLAAAPQGLLAYAAGFVLFRLADILKPWPASWADRTIHGGLGVMLDDILAGLYAALGLFILARFDLV